MILQNSSKNIKKIKNNDITMILKNKNPHKIRAKLSNWWRIRVFFIRFNKN